LFFYSAIKYLKHIIASASKGRLGDRKLGEGQFYALATTKGNNLHDCTCAFTAFIKGDVFYFGGNVLVLKSEKTQQRYTQESTIKGVRKNG
jgi:hypothetical protein